MLNGGGKSIYFSHDGITFVGNGSIFSACDEAELSYLNEEYRKYPGNEAKEIANTPEASGVMASVLNGSVLAEVTNGEKFVTAGGKTVYVYTVSGKPIPFNTNFVSLIKKRSKYMRIVSGGNLRTTALVGYDADGNVTGVALPIALSENFKASDGKTTAFATDRSMSALVKKAKNADANTVANGGDVNAPVVSNNTAENQSAVQGEKISDRGTDVAKVRETFSDKGKVVLDYALENTTADAKQVTDLFNLQYLSGFAGEALTIRPQTDVINEVNQKAAYEAGKAAKAALGTVTVAQGVNVSSDFKAFMNKAAKDLKVHIVMDATGEHRGQISKFGELHVSADAEVELADGRVLKGEDAARMIILGHEFTHRLEQLDKASYDIFADFAAGQKPTWAKVYTNNGYSPSAAKAEVASDYAMHTLFTDEATINKITKKHSKLALAIRNILAKLKQMFGGKVSELDMAIRLWNNAYNASIRSAKSDANVNAAAQNKNTADDGVKHSFAGKNAKTADGSKFAEAERMDSEGIDREQRKNTRPDIDRTDVVFADGEESYDINENFSDQLRDWISGGGKKNGSYNGEYFDLGTTPSIMVKHGAFDAPLIMYEDCVVKITGGKHEISIGELEKLPNELNDPILLFKGSVPNSFVALTEMRTIKGHDVVVAVHYKRMHKRTVINKIASLHSRTNEKTERNVIIGYVLYQIKQGNLLDASIKKAPIWFTNRGLQLPKLVQTIIDANNNVSQNVSVVNTQYMQNSQNNSSGNSNSTAGLDKLLFESEAEATEAVADKLSLDGKENYKADDFKAIVGVSAATLAKKYHVGKKAELAGLVARGVKAMHDGDKAKAAEAFLDAAKMIAPSAPLEARADVANAVAEGIWAEMTTDRLIPTIRSVRDNAIDNALAGDTITRLNALIEENDAIKPGVNPAREIAYPTKTADGKKVSLTARSAAEAEATPEEMMPTINRMAVNGDFSYTPITNEETLAKAEEKLVNAENRDAVIRDWFEDIGNKHASAENTVLGWAIYNQAANSGDTELAVDVLNKMVEYQRTLGQALQAARVLKKMTPLNTFFVIYVKGQSQKQLPKFIFYPNSQPQPLPWS